MDIREYIRVLRRRMWLILAFAFVCSATSALISIQLPKTYSSTTVALVSPKQVIANPQANGFDQLPSVDQMMSTYIGLIDTDPVRQRLSASGVPRTPEQLRGKIFAVRAPNTTLIDVTIKDSDPAVALLGAQKVLASVNQSLEELQSKVPGTNQNTHLEALVPWDLPTQRPTFPDSPNIPFNVGLAAGAGLLIAIGLAFLLERLDTTIKSDADVRMKLNLPLLGSIFYRPLDRVDKKTGRELEVIAATSATDPMVEQYRAIRTNIMFSRIDTPAQTIVVTSSIPGEGKTTTACNLAVVMAQAGHKVILVDADFRRPSLLRVFGLKPNSGLSNLLLGEGPIGDYLTKTKTPNLRVLGSGSNPPNPSELMGSTAMQRVLAMLQGSADLLIFDAPPIAPVTDATVLGALVDGLILVVESGKTPIQVINRSLDTLRAVGIEPMGVVLNKAATDAYPSYYYSYGEEPSVPRRTEGRVEELPKSSPVVGNQQT